MMLRFLVMFTKRFIFGRDFVLVSSDEILLYLLTSSLRLK